MKTRIANGLTTVLGLIILGAAFALIYLKLATMKEALGFMIIGAALLFSKDTEFINNFLRVTKGFTPGNGASSPNNAEFEEIKSNETKTEETK